MSDETQNIPEFSDEQRAYVQKILAEQGKTLRIGTELQTAEQRAEQYRAAGDFPGLKKEREAKHALIGKYGDRGYGDLQRRWLEAERTRKATEDREQRLAQSKARRSRI